MSRSGYVDDCENIGLWRGTVASALRGKRGQAFLREMRDAMDAMPDKRLIREALVADDVGVCAMGTVCAAREIDVSDIDPEDYERVAERLGLSRAMVQEIAYLNDELGDVWPRGHRNDDGVWVTPPVQRETPEERWTRMRAWVESQIRPEEAR